ncbi:MAG: hypothetical protein EOQ56_03960 [Mesorhizobium sp.]|nr:MAG: hypothetical protein EOQ56_03960 [Mesorhizobium sp.]
MIALINLRGGSNFNSLVLGTAITALLISSGAALGEENIRSACGYLYIAQIVSYFAIIYSRYDGDTFHLFKPSVTTFSYIGLSVAFGALSFNSGSVLKQSWYITFLLWNEFIYVYFAVSLALFGCFLIALMCDSDVAMVPAGRRVRPILSVPFIGIILVALVCSLFVDISYVAIARTVLALALFVHFFECRSRLRWLVVAMVVLLFAAETPDDKRNAIFLILPCLLMEFSSHRIQFRLRTVLISAILMTSCLYLIAAMSIIRGYGNYGPVSFFQAIYLVPDYVSSPGSLAMLANNLEVNYIFFVLHDAVHRSIFSDSDSLQYGWTYIRVLFVGWLDSSQRPDSIIESYTKAIDPEFRAIGGSYPPTAIGEVFWNFGVMGIFALPAILYALDKLYKQRLVAFSKAGLAGKVFSMTYIQFTVLYLRGSGLDLFLAYLLVAIAVVAAVIFPLSTLLKYEIDNTFGDDVRYRGLGVAGVGRRTQVRTSI